MLQNYLWTSRTDSSSSSTSSCNRCVLSTGNYAAEPIFPLTITICSCTEGTQMINQPTPSSNLRKCLTRSLPKPKGTAQSLSGTIHLLKHMLEHFPEWSPWTQGQPCNPGDTPSVQAVFVSLISSNLIKTSPPQLRQSRAGASGYYKGCCLSGWEQMETHSKSSVPRR